MRVSVYIMRVKKQLVGGDTGDENWIKFSDAI